MVVCSWRSIPPNWRAGVAGHTRGRRAVRSAARRDGACALFCRRGQLWQQPYCRAIAYVQLPTVRLSGKAIAMQLQKSGTELHSHWLPRLQNKEADALTNGWFADFCMQRRMRFELQSFEGVVLQDLRKLGLDLYECRAAKRMLCPQIATKVRKTETLKVRDPWQ